MKIDSTIFGAITIDGKTYEHDVVVRLSGEVVKRKKKLSKRLYGTSHVLSEDEAKFLFEKGCDQAVIGSGQMGNVHLSPEAEAYFERKAPRADMWSLGRVVARAWGYVAMWPIGHAGVSTGPMWDCPRVDMRTGGT
jgi:hypothetical protein